MQPSDLTALEQSAAIKRGDLTAVDLTEHYLERTASLGDTVGAFATVMADQALRDAAHVDARLQRGEGHELPLFGCVAPVKDLDPVAGVPCTYGSRVFAELIPPADADFVTRMRAAGLVVTGKTNTPEFGLPCYTENDLFPPARTPWDLTRSAGGSSGGAAAAVAARLASVAQGSDGGGSIRIPASVTGLVGIKPSRGRVTWAPGIDGVGELAVIGPLARSVADAAALLDVLAGGRAGDPCGLPDPEPGSFLAAARRPPGRRLRVGRFAEPMIAETEVHPDCLGAYEAASGLLADLGHTVEDIPRPLGPDVVGSFEVVWRSGAAAVPVAPEQEELLLPLTRHLRERGREISATELVTAVLTMRVAARNAIDATADYDVLLTPTLAQLPAAVGALRDDADPAGDFEAQKRFTPFTSPFNVSGQPAMSLPLHLSGDGLPIGVHLVGRPRAEWTLITLAAELEEAVGWHRRRAPIA